MNIIAYYRVSTKMQGESGLGIEGQQNAVRTFATANNHTIIAEYTEQESGAHDNRPQLTQAIAQASKECATLVIAKLDRLSRNLTFLSQINDKVRDGKLKVQALDFAEFNTISVGFLATMAQWERERISERTKQALQAKKARGEKLGQTFKAEDRARGHETHRNNSRNNPENIRAWAYIQLLPADMSNKAIAEQLNANGFTTARGGKWQSIQVQRFKALMQG